MGPRARPLPAFEVAVGRRRAALSGPDLVGVHAETHRAAGTAPLRAGGDEHVVQTFRLGLFLHLHRAGYDETLAAVGTPTPAKDVCGGAQVLDPAVGAGADEHRV